MTFLQRLYLAVVLLLAACAPVPPASQPDQLADYTERLAGKQGFAGDRAGMVQ